MITTDEVTSQLLISNDLASSSDLIRTITIKTINISTTQTSANKSIMDCKLSTNNNIRSTMNKNNLISMDKTQRSLMGSIDEHNNNISSDHTKTIDNSELSSTKHKKGGEDFVEIIGPQDNMEILEKAELLSSMTTQEDDQGLANNKHCNKIDNNSSVVDEKSLTTSHPTKISTESRDDDASSPGRLRSLETTTQQPTIKDLTDDNLELLSTTTATKLSVNDNSTQSGPSESQIIKTTDSVKSDQNSTSEYQQQLVPSQNQESTSTPLSESTQTSQTNLETSAATLLPQSANNRSILILREISPDTPESSVKNIFNSENCPIRPIHCEYALHDSWYVTFQSDVDAKLALAYIRKYIVTWNGEPIMARYKPKSAVPTANTYQPPPNLVPPLVIQQHEQTHQENSIHLNGPSMIGSGSAPLVAHHRHHYQTAGGNTSHLAPSAPVATSRHLAYNQGSQLVVLQRVADTSTPNASIETSTTSIHPPYSVPSANVKNEDDKLGDQQTQNQTVHPNVASQAHYMHLHCHNNVHDHHHQHDHHQIPGANQYGYSAVAYYGQHGSVLTPWNYTNVPQYDLSEVFIYNGLTPYPPANIKSSSIAAASTSSASSSSSLSSSKSSSSASTKSSSATTTCMNLASQAKPTVQIGVGVTGAALLGGADYLHAQHHIQRHHSLNNVNARHNLNASNLNHHTNRSTSHYHHQQLQNLYQNQHYHHQASHYHPNQLLQMYTHSSLPAQGLKASSTPNSFGQLQGQVQRLNNHHNKISTGGSSASASSVVSRKKS